MAVATDSDKDQQCTPALYGKSQTARQERMPTGWFYRFYFWRIFIYFHAPQVSADVRNIITEKSIRILIKIKSILPSP